jgi:osmoprotectant transport system permease protein
MNELSRAFTYVTDNRAEFLQALVEHLQLSLLALAIAVVLCVPLGVWAAKQRIVAQPIINLANALRVIPSLAILFLALPYLGIGFPPALIALTVLACPPVLINTYAGYRGVDRAVVEAARGMGMTLLQSLRSIETPLALPVVIAGIRIAAVEVIASATLAAFIGAGALGIYIQRGFAANQLSLMFVGAIPIALLTLLADGLLATAQRAAAIPGI